MWYKRLIVGLACAILLIPSALAQITVTGTVVEAGTEQPLPGVQVFVQGTLTGTTTTVDGTYNLQVPEFGMIIAFRFVGFSTQEIPLEPGKDAINVRLFESVLGLEEVVVVGSRRVGRLVQDSSVPVDVFGPRDLTRQGSTDIDDILRTQVPSYQVIRNAIQAEASFVRPFTLRGLPSDNVVVLVNGKRRHRTAALAGFGPSVNVGAQGTDLMNIPTIALGRLEILRDGASAQYGADAVAGVMDLQLRRSSSGVRIRMQGGQYIQGDGDGRHGLIAANVGLPLTQNGFLNLSAEFRDAEPTIRSGHRTDEIVLRQQGYPVRDPAQIWGNPDVHYHWATFLNAGVDVGENLHLYAFGGYSARDMEGGFYFRSPGTTAARNAMFRFGDGANAVRAVADLDLNDDIACQELPDIPGLDSGPGPVDSFVQQYQGQCFLFNELFRGGFTPQFGSAITDLSGNVGLRGGKPDGLNWDATVTYGHSTIGQYIYDTVNASLGPATPTSFEPTAFTQTDVTASLDMSYPIAVSAFATSLNVAWGVEWRQETFESKPGDPASYEVGPYAIQGFSSGSNGFPGLNPDFAGRWSRPNYAAYVDLESDVTERWVLGLAGRHENFYDSFGATLTGKISALYRATDRIRLRGTTSTGYRAPTPGQANLWVLQTSANSKGELVEAGQLPSDHPISEALGGKPLTEERARSLSLGTIMDIAPGITLTFDYFDITLNDRIALTGNIAISGQLQQLMNEANLLGGVRNLQEVKFYSNDFDTRTKGTDLLLVYDIESENGRATMASLAWNWTWQRVKHHSEPQVIHDFLGTALQAPFQISVLSPRRQVELETHNPRHRAVFSFRHIAGRPQLLARLSYYSGWQVCRLSVSSCYFNGEYALDQYKGAILLDLELGYRFGGSYRAAIGVDNLLNRITLAHPDETAVLGYAMQETSPWDFNGRAVYVRLSADLF